MPFAGTEGYNPVAYAPYVLALTHWKSARARFSEHATPDALRGPDSIHGPGSVCHQAQSDTEMGIRAHRDAAGIDLQSVSAQR